MIIAIIGASGKAGNAIMKEALDRGLEATAIVRSAAKIKDNRALVVERDIFAITSEGRSVSL